MTKDCNGTIDQDPGELKITYDVSQCQTCPENDCPGHTASTQEGPSEYELPNKVYEGPFNAKTNPEPSPDDLYNALLSNDPATIPPEISKAINAFGTISLQTITELMAGRATGFLIVTTGPVEIKEWHYMDEATRISALVKLSLKDLEKKIPNITPARWLASVLDLLK